MARQPLREWRVFTVESVPAAKPPFEILVLDPHTRTIMQGNRRHDHLTLMGDLAKKTGGTGTSSMMRAWVDKNGRAVSLLPPPARRYVTADEVQAACRAFDHPAYAEFNVGIYGPGTTGKPLGLLRELKDKLPWKARLRLALHRLESVLFKETRS